MRNLAMACCLILFSQVSSLRGQQIEYSRYGISVTLNQPSDEAFHGYTEYRAQIQNTSDEPHEVIITLPDSKGGTRHTHLREIRRAVNVAQNSTVNISLFQPDFPAPSGQGIRVTIDGSDQEKTFPATFGWGRGPRRAMAMGATVSYLALRSDNAGAFANLFDQCRQGIGGNRRFRQSSMGEVEITSADFPVEGWSEHWLGYTRYDAIILTARDLSRMKPAVRSVIWRYAEAGGVLLILGDTKVPKEWTLTQQPNQRALQASIYHAGWGTCFLSTKEDVPAEWFQWNWPAFHLACTRTAAPWRTSKPVMEAHERFPVVDDLSIPVKGLFVLMILFGLLIGPLNIGFLKRIKRRIWLLWTVPVIAFGTCLAVLLFMLIVEGWDRHLRTETITVLNQSSKRASTIGWTGFYAPIIPGEGLQFSPDTELLLQDGGFGGHGAHRYPYGRGNRACTIDWTNQQHYPQGWMAARVPCQFQVRKSEIRSECINVSRSDDDLQITNLLGAPIEKFWLMDEKGRVYLHEKIEAGARVTLKPKPGMARPEEPESGATLRSLYNQGDFLGAQRSLARNPEQYLKPLTYIAEMNASPFFEDGIPDASEKKHHCWVYGMLQEIQK